MTARAPVKFGLRKKLFFLTLVAFTLLIVTTSWQIGVQANKVANTSIEQSLNQARIVLETKIDSRYLTIADVANSIAKDGRVLPLVFDQESPTLQDLSLEFQKVLDFDILFFTTAEGEVLARSDRPDAIGQNLAGRSELFDNALRGQNSRGIFISGDKFLQIVVVPIFDNLAKDLVRGTVALAYEFSDELAEEIRALTASEVMFFVFSRDGQREVNGVAARGATNAEQANNVGEFFNQNPKYWQSIYQSKATASDMSFVIDNERFSSAYQALGNSGGDNLGFVMTLKSRQELLAPFLDIQRIVIIVGVICLLVAVTFAWFFAIRMSRPIVKLVSIAENIQEGNYPDLKPKTRVSDEVGVLYNAVVAMGNSLKDKAELETYLAQISSELDYGDSAVRAFNDSDLQQHMMTQTSPTDQRSSPLIAEDETLAHLPSHGDSSRSPPLIFDGIIDDRYKIIRHIGAGAIGTVYLAHDIALDENVAIKMMPAEIFSSQDTLNFKEEIKLARKITHRNILRTFDFGVWQNYYYITMEYVAGYDLGMLLKTKGAFNTHIGLTMARQICSAMNAAHEQGIIHRDLKPSNMMINRQGILKIMDFGLAMKIKKSEQGATPEKPATGDATTIAGTPRYMAPEQFFNWPLDERTDIYAIGIILYAVFNGSPPFTAQDITELSALHLNTVPPRITIAGRSLPEKLQDIIFKALEKKPENRYQSARDILDDLNQFGG